MSTKISQKGNNCVIERWTIVKLEEASNTLELQKSGVIELALKIISETSNLIMKSKTILVHSG